MATTPLQPIVLGVGLTTSFTDLYEVPAGKAGIGIDAAVFNNYSETTATYTVRLIQTGVSGVLNEVITEKNIRAKANDLAPAMIGQSLITGGIIQAKASVEGAISVNITATIVDA